MELTPEERQRIYEEEKARIEARESITSERRHKAPSWTAVGCGVVLGLFALLWVIGTVLETNSPSGNSSVSVTYSVFSDGDVEVSYSNATNGMDHVRSRWDWQKTVRLPAGTVAYITAQNQGDHGDVVVNIACNGRDVKGAKSSGAYAIATATARCD